MGTSQRIATSDTSDVAEASTGRVADKSRGASLLIEDLDGAGVGVDAGSSEAPGAAKPKPKRKKVARRVYKAKRTIPPYSHAAWSSAMLLQSVFRGC